MHRTLGRFLAGSLLALGALAIAPQAYAQLYVGFAAGQSDMDDGNMIPALITTGPIDGEDKAWKLFGGYQFNSNFGVELAYVDLGKASYSGTFQGAAVTNGTLEITGVNISAVGTLPLNQSFDLFGKVGIFTSDSKANDVTGGVPFSGEQDKSKVSFGVGVSWNLAKNVGLRAEWERLKAVDDIDLVTVGFAFKF